MYIRIFICYTYIYVCYIYLNVTIGNKIHNIFWQATADSKFPQVSSFSWPNNRVWFCFISANMHQELMAPAGPSLTVNLIIWVTQLFLSCSQFQFPDPHSGEGKWICDWKPGSFVGSYQKTVLCGKWRRHTSHGESWGPFSIGRGYKAMLETWMHGVVLVWKLTLPTKFQMKPCFWLLY